MTMKTLSMCRICLVENVRMYVVVNRHLQEMYEKLTNIPLVTQDSRPMLVCYFCITKLKQCCRLQRKCLEAEEMFAWMLDEDYQKKPRNPVNQVQLKFSSYIISPTEHISIFDECQTESDVIKTELSDDYEGQDNIVELQEEHQTDQKHELKDIEYIEFDIPAPHSELEADDDVPFKIKEEQKVSKKKPKAKGMKKSKHEFQDIENIFKPTRYSEPEDVPPQHTESEDIPIQHSESDSKDDFLLKELKTEVVEEQEVSKTKQNPEETKRATVAKTPKIDIGRKNLEHTSAIQINQTEYNFCNKVINIVTKRHRSVNIEDYYCEICQKSFSQKGHLTVHMRIHTKEKPYKCETCQRSFRVKSNLTQHIRTHTGEKPYTCELCQRSFAQKATLLAHIRVHKLKRSKSFKCNLCKRCFAQSSHLKTHMRVHTRDNLTNVNIGEDDLPE